MMVFSDETELREWLGDYLVTNIGCSPDDVEFEVSLHDLGVGSRDAVVLAGALSELLDRTVSPVDLWQHPTINALARFLCGAEPDVTASPVLDNDHHALDEPIAVIGLGCRFPGGVEGLDEYWQLLSESRSAVAEVPPDRWQAFDDGSPEAAAVLSRTTRWGSFLADVDAFDAEFFEISPNEAAKMDPQQRLLLEVTHEALEHAGIPAPSLRLTQTGVFAGACAGEYGYLAADDLSQIDAWSGTGGALSIIANRVSYFFDLLGPSVTVDTACSSSLVAVHLACQSLRTGDSNLAVAAGVNLLLSPAITRSFDAAEAMSPTGQCHAFDASADGFVRGEGCGVAVLKRLSDALRDGDRVLAVVRGSAVNQDGRSNGLMAPNPAAQMAVLRAAYANAGVEPRDVDYVEAHGTGTLLGDPIEARALGTVLGRAHSQDAPLLIGAVKSNLGHLEAAAGIAGFIKAVLALQHARIPANFGFDAPNPHIPFADLRLKVVAEETDWPAVGRPRRAGVSSFGFGGTNAHVVLEQAPAVEAVAPLDSEPVVNTLVISGKTGERVVATAAALADWMEGDGATVGVADVAHTLNQHRGQYAKFATVCARDRGQAVAGLRALAGEYSAPGAVGVHEGRCRPGTVFVYSGQGSQWAGMGRQLLADEPTFAAAVDELEPVFVEQVGFSLRKVLECGEPVVGIDRIQPVLVGVQLALTALWRCYGVEPDAVIGHSMGEVAAAVVAGALSPADGLKVIATRSKLMARLSGQGAMALLELEAEAVEELIADYPGVTVAVYASPRQTVIAGKPDDIDAIVAMVDARDRLARRIEVDVASHSPIVDPILPELRIALSGIAPATPRIPLIDTAGHGNDGEPGFDADYWVANLRNPVRFHQAVSAAGADHGTFIEVSPHPVLTHTITDTLAGQHHHSIATLARDGDDTLTFHTSLNATHTTHPPQTPHPPEPHPILPSTPWRHTHHWIPQTKDTAGTAGSAPRAGTLLGEHLAIATAPSTQLWQARLVPEAKPYPGVHRIQGVEVVPVSVLLQTVLSAAAECGTSTVAGVRFEHPVVVDQPRLIQVVVDAETVTVSSSPTTNSGPNSHRWVRHVTAELFSSEVEPDVDGDARAVVDGEPYDIAGGDSQSAAELLEAWGVEGQPFPWSIEAVRYPAGGVVAEIGLPEASSAALLDAATHVACLVDRSNPRLMVPAAVRSVRFGPALADPHGSVEVRRQPGNDDELIVDIAVRTPDGSTCIDIRGLRYADVEADRPGPGNLHHQHADPRSFAHAIEWQPWREDDDWPASAPGPLAVVGPDDTAAAELRNQLRNCGYVPAEVTEARDVVYLADAEPGDTGIDAAVRVSSQVSGLVQVLAGRDEQHPARLWIITRGVHQASSGAALAQGSLWGIAAVIAAEEPDLWGGLVDVPTGDPVGAFAPALGRILGRRGHKPSKSILVLHEGEFLAPALVAISGPPVREPLRCRPDAAYLITGGLGELGLLMADWLVDHGARRLILAGRSALPPRHDWDTDDLGTDDRRKIAAIRALERRGVSVDVVTLDVGVPDAVQALLARRDRDCAPPIRGVIHAAGITENKLLTDLADSTLRQVMWPKVAGGQVLHEAFPPGHLDFFFLTASAGTTFGVPGQGAYAAANAYLDCLARTRHRQGCHTVSLDWVAWEGLGFGADATITVQELDRLGSRPLLPEEAFAAWEHVDRYDIAQAVIAPMSSAEPDEDHAATPVHAWAVMTADEVLRELETGLHAILARELGLPEAELEPDLPFAELGLNSVMAMSIRREVEQFVGIDLSATMLWNHPTVTSLAVYLANKLAPRQDSEDGGIGLGDSESSVLDDLLGSVESAT